MTSAFVLDKSIILDRLGGDEEIFVMMVDMYAQDVDNNCAVLAKAFAAGDQMTLLREAHTVKGLLATFADDEGAALAFAIEQQVKQGELGGLEMPISALQARLREVAGALKGALINPL